MKKEIKYYCEICGKDFCDEQQCIDHEKECLPLKEKIKLKITEAVKKLSNTYDIELLHIQVKDSEYGYGNDYDIELILNIFNQEFRLESANFERLRDFTDREEIIKMLQIEILKNYINEFEGKFIKNPDQSGYDTLHLFKFNNMKYELDEIAYVLKDKKIKIQVVD